MTYSTTTPRRLPEPPCDLLSRCDGCGGPLVWAYTVAGPSGPGGKLIPLDPVEDLAAGNVSVVQPSARGRLLARVLGRDETVDRPIEYAASTHFATCPTRTRPSLPPAAAPPAMAPARRRR